MDAIEELIRAYAFYELTPDKAGDSDLNTAGTAIIRRRRKGMPAYGKETRTAKGSNNAVYNALRAGKIIAAGEGTKIHEASYARVYYSEHAKKRDRAILLRYLLERAQRMTKNDLTKIMRANNIFFHYANAAAPHNDDIKANHDVFIIVSQTLDRLHHGTATRVGKMLSVLKN